MFMLVGYLKQTTCVWFYMGGIVSSTYDLASKHNSTKQRVNVFGFVLYLFVSKQLNGSKVTYTAIFVPSSRAKIILILYMRNLRKFTSCTHFLFE